jgi:hypothetical protein
MSFEDKTGQPVSDQDIDEAIAVVTRAMVLSVLKLPPELAVQMPNIHRCLKRAEGASYAQRSRGAQMRTDRSRYLANGKPSCRANCRWPRGECPDHPLPEVMPPEVFADPRSVEHIEICAEYPVCKVCNYQRCSCPIPLGWHENKWWSGKRGFERDDKRGAVWPDTKSVSWQNFGSNINWDWGCGPSPELGNDNYSSTLAWGRTGLKTSTEAMAFVDEQLKAEDAAKAVPPTPIAKAREPKFKVGDLVRCVQLSSATDLEIGQVYRVMGTPELDVVSCLYIEGVKWFRAWQFDLVAPDDVPSDWERIDAGTYRHKDSGWNVLKTDVGQWLPWHNGASHFQRESGSKILHEAMAAALGLNDVCDLWS